MLDFHGLRLAYNAKGAGFDRFCFMFLFLGDEDRA